MHQEAFPGEDISDRPPPEESVPGLLRAARRRPARAAATGREPSAGDRRRMSAGCRRRTSRRRSSAAPSRPRRAAWRRDDVRLLVACRGDRRSAHHASPTCPTSSSPATCWSSTPRHPARRGPRRPAPARRTSRRRSTGAPRPDAAPSAGWSSCAGRRTRRHRGGRAGRAARAARAAATAELLGAVPRRPARLWVGARSTAAGAACSTTSPRTAARSATATSPEPCPLAAYQTVFATEPGSAEMPSAGRPFTAELVTDARGRGRRRRPARPAHRRVVARGGRAAVPGAFRVPADDRRRGRRDPRRGGRVIAVGTTVVRALETAADDAGTSPGDGWTELVVTPSGACASSTACSPAGTSRDASHLLLLEAVAGRGCSSAPTPRRWPTATAGTSSATRT